MVEAVMISSEKDQQVQISAEEAIEQCVICWLDITDEIMMCPKDGVTLLCKFCIGRLTIKKCPVCKEEVAPEEYARNRRLEEIRDKKMQLTVQGYCNDHELDHVYFCVDC